MTDLAIALGLTFLLVCGCIAVLHSRRVGRVTMLDWSVLAMGGVYGGGWALVVFFTEEGGNRVWEEWLVPFHQLYPLHTLVALILLTFVCLGWKIAKPSGRRLIPNSVRTGHYNTQRLNQAGWALLLIAVTMQWLYVSAYGGFLGLLEYSALIRSGMLAVENPWSFFQPFGGLALFSSFVFLGLLLSDVGHTSSRLGFVVAFLFSIYILFSWMGRIGFFVYLFSIVLGVVLAKKVRPLKLLLYGGILMVGILYGAFQVSLWLNIKAADNFSFFLTRELSFPFVSFFAQVETGEHMLRVFRDFLLAPVYLLPSSWWTNWVENISQVNTAVIMGAAKGEQGVTGGMPVDLITLGLMQAAVVGVAFVGVLFGAMLRVMQVMLDKTRHAGLRAVFEAYLAIKIAVLSVFYAQPALVVSSNFDLLVSIGIIGAFSSSPRIRVRSIKDQHCRQKSDVRGAMC